MDRHNGSLSLYGEPRPLPTAEVKLTGDGKLTRKATIIEFPEGPNVQRRLLFLSPVLFTLVAQTAIGASQVQPLVELSLAPDTS